MADNVFIDGLGGGVPAWSTEATQEKLLQKMTEGVSKDTAAGKQMIILLGKISRGEKATKDQLTKAVQALGDIKSSTDDSAASAKGNKKSNDQQLGLFTRLLSGMDKQTAILKKQENWASKSASYMKQQGMSKGAADMQASFDGVGDTFGKFMSEANENGIKIAASIAAAVNGLTASFETGVEDRFNLAQEMRQSGMFAGMDTASAGLMNLAKTVTGANFTFGEAQAFTQKFSQAIGVRGVKASMEFADSIASSGDEGSNYMNKFGMEFREVTDIAGTYMESVRTLGHLDKLSNSELRTGMDSFMTTVVSTSNIMKINLQDAAEMIKDTLKQDKFVSMLSTLDKTTADTVKNMVGQFGGQDSPFAQALATRLAAGSQGAFAQTSEFSAINSDAITQQFLPMIEKIAGAVQGGPDAMNAALASLGPDLREMIASGKSMSSLVMSDTGSTRASLAAAIQLEQMISKADAGYVGTSAADQAVNLKSEVERTRQRESENFQNMALNQIDIAKEIGELNESRVRFIGALADFTANYTTTLSQAMTFATDAKNFANNGLSLMFEGFAFVDNLVKSEEEISALRGNTTGLENLTTAIQKSMGTYVDPRTSESQSSASEGFFAMDNLNGKAFLDLVLDLNKKAGTSVLEKLGLIDPKITPARPEPNMFSGTYNQTLWDEKYSATHDPDGTEKEPVKSATTVTPYPTEAVITPALASAETNENNNDTNVAPATTVTPTVTPGESTSSDVITQSLLTGPVIKPETPIVAPSEQISKLGDAPTIDKLNELINKMLENNEITNVTHLKRVISEVKGKEKDDYWGPQANTPETQTYNKQLDGLVATLKLLTDSLIRQ